VYAAIENIWGIVGDEILTNPSFVGYTEKKYILHQNLELGGTADFSYRYIDRETGETVFGIWDYKNGVIETDIIQLVQYLCGMRRYFAEEGIPVASVYRGHIFQPNGLDETKRIKNIELSVEDIFTYEKKFVKLAETALGFKGMDKLNLVPGEEQCKFCDAKVICPEVHKQSRDIIKSVVLKHVQSTLPDPATLPELMSDEDVLKWLKFSDYFKQIDNAMWSYALTRFQMSNPLPGTMATYGRSNRKIIPDHSKLRNTIENLGIDSANLFTMKVKGVGEIEKILKQFKVKPDIREEVLSEITYKDEPSLKIALDDESNADRVQIDTPKQRVIHLVKQHTKETENGKQE